MKRFLQKKYIFSIMSVILLVIGGLSNKQSQNLFFNKKNTTHSNTQENKATDFLYVASWSPAYCAERDPEGRGAQCRHDLPKQYRFIIHGLWPQAVNDGYLNYCKPVSETLQANIVNDYFYLMPSSKLMAHQWKKHASCGNFTQKTYFKTIENLYKKFEIAALFADIHQTQSFSLDGLLAKLTQQIPHIDKENIVIRCRKNNLKEIRICLDQNFAPRKCHYTEIRSGGCRKDAKIMVKYVHAQ